MSLRAFWTAWQNFWLASGSPLPLALCRIFFGILVICAFLWIWPDADTFFGPRAIISPQTSAAWRGYAQFDLLSFLPGDELSLRIMLVLFALSGLALICGFFSRISAFIAFLIMLTLDTRCHFALHTGTTVMRMMLLYLAVSRCGDALTLSGLFRSLRKSGNSAGPSRNCSILGQRLIQVQLAIVYWGAFAPKLNGQSWLNGSAVYYATHQTGFLRFHIPYLFDQLWTCQLLSWSTLITEFSLCILVWIQPLRYWVLLAGVFFHLGLEWSLRLPLFEYIMLASYICFVDAADITQFAALIRTWVGRVTGAATGSLSRGSLDE